MEYVTGIGLLFILSERFQEHMFAVVLCDFCICYFSFTACLFARVAQKVSHYHISLLNPIKTCHYRYIYTGWPKKGILSRHQLKKSH